MKHNVDRELGLALDCAIKEYTVEGVLDAPKKFYQWSGHCEPLNRVNTFQLAKYIIEGYDYPKSKEETIATFTEWLKNFNIHTPPISSNSSYRKGRKHVLEEIDKKLIELKIV